MGLLKLLFIFFILIFPLAEVGRFQFASGIAVSVNDIFLFATIILWVVYKLIRSTKKKTPPLLKKPIIAFSAVAFVSLVINVFNLSTQSAFISLLYLIRWFCYSLLYFIVLDFNPVSRKSIVNVLLIAGGLVVLAGYVQFFFYPNLKNLYYLGWDDHLYRMFSTFFDPNFAGAFFVIYFMFTLKFLFEFGKNFLTPKNLSMLFINLLSLGAIYLTYSRSAFLMLVVSLISLLWLKRKRKYIMIVFAFLILLIFITPKAFKLEGTNFLRTVSTQERYYSMQQAIGVFSKSPILGVGFNSYRYALNREFGLNNDLWQATHAGAGTDNSYLFVLATTGVIGFSVYLYLLYKICLLGKIRSNYGIVFVSIFMGLVVDSLFINSLFYVLLLEWVWILAALTESS